MKFDPKNPPKAGDMQISASFLNDLLKRIARLETLHAKSPINLQESRGGLCLSLTKDIQVFRLAEAQEIHNGDTTASECKMLRYQDSTNTFDADDSQVIQVYDPFGVGFWPNQKILVTKYYDSDRWIHLPLQDKLLYGVTSAVLSPCTTVSVERVVNGALSGEFYQAYNPHDWDGPSGLFIQAKWEKQFEQYLIYSVDCEASCLGL